MIDGNTETPALRFADTPVIVNPSELIWTRIKKGEPCNLRQEFERIKKEVESVLEA